MTETRERRERMKLRCENELMTAGSISHREDVDNELKAIQRLWEEVMNTDSPRGAATASARVLTALDHFFDGDQER